MLDEAMGAAVWHAGTMAVAVNLNVDYRRPVPLGVEIEIIGQVIEKDGKTLHTRGEIRLPNGKIAVVGKGRFVEAKHLFDQEENDFKSTWI